jgi:hypothetical protein
VVEKREGECLGVSCTAFLESVLIDHFAKAVVSSDFFKAVAPS